MINREIFCKSGPWPWDGGETCGLETGTQTETELSRPMTENEVEILISILLCSRVLSRDFARTAARFASRATTSSAKARSATRCSSLALSLRYFDDASGFGVQQIVQRIGSLREVRIQEVQNMSRSPRQVVQQQIKSTTNQSNGVWAGAQNATRCFSSTTASSTWSRMTGWPQPASPTVHTSAVRDHAAANSRLCLRYY